MHKVALVTGAGGGIGSAIATSLSSRGAEVLLLDSVPENTRKIAADVLRSGGAATALTADVRSRQDLERARAELGQKADTIDVLVNCAGVLKTTPFLDISAEEWRLMLDTHLKGTFLVCQTFVPGIIKRGAGLVINMSSDLAISGSPERAHYCAAKRAIHALTKSLAAELAPHRIRAVSIGPGPVDTSMLREGLSEQAYQRKLEEIGKRVPLGRPGTAQDVANLASWLALGGGSQINGQMLHVNGGTVMH